MTLTVDNGTRNAVIRELEWDPKVDASNIRVVAHDGIVVLSGIVCSSDHRWEATRAAKRVAGVTAVSDEIEVKWKRAERCYHETLAEGIAHQIDWQ